MVCNCKINKENKKFTCGGGIELCQKKQAKKNPCFQEWRGLWRNGGILRN